MLVGDEPEPPYSRMAIPYLLMGDIGEEGTYLRKGRNHFALQRIELCIGRAKSLDTVARSVQLDDGTNLPFDRLLIATGSVPVRVPIPGIDLPGVSPCWTLADAREIMARPNRVRGCCRWAPASSAASFLKRSPRAAFSSRSWKWVTGWYRG